MATDAPPHVARTRRAQQLRGVYVIVNDSTETLGLADAALDAGVRVLQYRAKHGADERCVMALRARTRRRGALLILNDDWRMARNCGCDGVHLGPGDDGFASPGIVRAGAPELLIGLSCGTPAEVDDATQAEVDYLGIGAVFATASKDDAGAPIGIEGLRALTARTALPVAAIGGIDASRLRAVRHAGVAMAAVIGAIANAPDARRAAAELVEIWDSCA